MRILQVSSAKTFGGGEKHLVDLCKGLFDKNHDVFVAIRKECHWKNWLDFLPKENIFTVPLKNSLDFFSSKRLARLIREKNIEIIHAHLARDYPIASLAVRFEPKAKLILTRHVLFPMKGIHKISLKNVSKVIAVSKAAEKNLKRTFPSEKIIHVPNGIKIEKFADVNRAELGKDFRFKHNISFDTKLVGTVGELKELKGQKDFILAANEITRKKPDTHFIVVGKDNSSDKIFYKELTSLIKNFNLEEKFTFLDWVDDTVPLLSSLDVFVSPSYSESFGLAILEAMANGCAIVSTETEGAKELIRDDFSGKLVPIENSNELANAIYTILKNRSNFGKNAQSSARENFSLEKMIEKTEKLYEKIL